MSELSSRLREARRYEACDDARGNLPIPQSVSSSRFHLSIPVIARHAVPWQSPDPAKRLVLSLTVIDYCHCEASAHHSDARETRDDPGFAGCGNPFSSPPQRAFQLSTFNS